jgi:crotonobetainyl-CoA:carnitine CoA-transferase CaiB-like acyl-CoA transferase
MADTVTGVFAAFAALAALRERGEGDAGQVVDLGLYESLFRLVDSQVIGYDQLGLVKERMGNRLGEDAPRNAYETADGRWIAISASSNRTWARLAGAIGRPELAHDPRFASSSSRVKNVEPLDDILAAWFRLHDCDDAMDVLDHNDVTAGPVLSVAEISGHPQYLARENVVRVADPDFGEVAMQGVVPKFSRTPGGVRFPGLEPGAHNAEVFGDLLGIGEGRRSELVAQAVI